MHVVNRESTAATSTGTAPRVAPTTSASKAVVDARVAALEQAWEQQTGRVLVRPVAEFLRAVTARSSGR